MVSVMIQLMFHSVQTVNKAGLDLNVILDVMANKYQWIVVIVYVKASVRAQPTTACLHVTTMVYVTIKHRHVNVMMVLDLTQLDTGETCVTRNNALVLENLVVVMENVYKEDVAVMKDGQ